MVTTFVWNHIFDTSLAHIVAEKLNVVAIVSLQEINGDHILFVNIIKFALQYCLGELQYKILCTYTRVTDQPNV